MLLKDPASVIAVTFFPFIPSRMKMEEFPDLVEDRFAHSQKRCRRWEGSQPH
jgi:hypothetical protein